MRPPRWVDAAAVAAALGPRAAVDALEAALLAGLDPEADPPRTVVPAGVGAPDGAALLAMPSAAGGHVAAKLVTVGGDPRVQGVCVVFDPTTLAPVALLDGIAPTDLRTPAVSALAVRHLVAPGARRALVIGRGPQGRGHAEALRAVLPGLDRVDVVGRLPAEELTALAADTDVVCCCTTAREPLFDSDVLRSNATVVAVGSHEPGAREVDERLCARATVVVESRASALREAGDVVLALAAGALRPDDLVGLAAVVRGEAAVDTDRPRLFKSTGMAWEDAVVAAAVVAAA